jgi:hypothetical protein
MLAFVRLPAIGGVQWDSPSAGGLGVSPNLKLPQEWGIQGVEKGLLNPFTLVVLSYGWWEDSPKNCDKIGRWQEKTNISSLLESGGLEFCKDGGKC